jgi:hypothetical protein
MNSSKSGNVKPAFQPEAIDDTLAHQRDTLRRRQVEPGQQIIVLLDARDGDGPRARPSVDDGRMFAGPLLGTHRMIYAKIVAARNVGSTMSGPRDRARDGHLVIQADEIRCSPSPARKPEPRAMAHLPGQLPQPPHRLVRQDTSRCGPDRRNRTDRNEHERRESAGKRDRAATEPVSAERRGVSATAPSSILGSIDPRESWGSRRFGAGDMRTAR